MHEPSVISTATNWRTIPGLVALPKDNNYRSSFAPQGGRIRTRHIAVPHAAGRKGFLEHLPACLAAGLAAAILLVDPGISFAAEARPLPTLQPAPMS